MLNTDSIVNYFIIITVLLLSSIAIYPSNEKYPYRWAAENVSVCSDISLEFSKEHAEHALLTWKYFSKIYKYSPGKKLELYYTLKNNVFQEELKKYPAIIIKGGRQITSFWADDHRNWFIIPYQIPDFGTQLHEISHDFLYFTFPLSEEYPWFKEGSGMYFESGKFNAGGDLLVSSPHKEYYSLFKQWKVKGGLLPLTQLLNMKKEDFYKADFTKTYSQSLMFFYYLMKNHHKVMQDLFGMINTRKISTNHSLVQYIIHNTKESLEVMEQEYIKFDETEE